MYCLSVEECLKVVLLEMTYWMVEHYQSKMEPAVEFGCVSVGVVLFGILWD